MLAAVAYGRLNCQQLPQMPKQCTLSPSHRTSMVRLVYLTSCLVMCGSAVDRVTWPSLFLRYVTLATDLHTLCSHCISMKYLPIFHHLCFVLYHVYILKSCSLNYHSCEVNVSITYNVIFVCLYDAYCS